MISVIVPVYNVKDYLERCVNSILTQNYKDLEVFLVDDGSTDGSSTICDALAEKDNRIVVIHKENGGLSSARNIAIDQAKGDFLFFVDSDDYIMPGILQQLIDACITYRAEVACCGYITGKDSFYCNGEVEEIDSMEATKRMFVCSGIDANAVCKLYAKRLFDDIRYPICAYEVVPVTYRILLKANKIVNIYKPGYYIEKRDGSITRAKFGFNNLLYVTMSYEEYKKISKDYPELEKYAFTFFLNALVSMRERAEIDSDNAIDENKQKVLKLFDSYFNDILKDSMLSRRKKIISLLIRIKMYKFVFDFYRKIR